MGGLAAGEIGGAAGHLNRNFRNPADKLRARLFGQKEPYILGVFERERERQQLFGITELRVQIAEETERLGDLADKQCEFEFALPAQADRRYSETFRF